MPQPSPTTSHASPSPLRFAENLAQLRRQRGLSIKTAAAELGVGRSTWSQWEAAKRYPPPDLFDCVAAFFGVPACRLIAAFPPPCQPGAGTASQESPPACSQNVT